MTSPFQFQTGGPTVLPLTAVGTFFDGQYSVPRLPHPEAVAVGPDGAVWCGNANGEILRIEPDGSRIESIASTDGFTLGMAFDGAGHLFVCDLRSAAVWRLVLATRALERFSPPGIRIPNYPVVDAARRCLYVSDSFAFGQSGPGVWRYDLATGAGTLWWDKPMNFANGMALSLDGTALFVVETFARKISRIAIGPDGQPRGCTDASPTLPGLPDGIAFDDAGLLYVSCYEPSRILRIGHAGEVEVYAEDPTAHAFCHPTNIAFDGPVLYTANLGRWHITRVATDTTGQSLAARAAALGGMRP